MHQTRRELIDNFLSFINELGDAQARTLAEQTVNRALTTLWLKHPWRCYRSPAPIQITVAANQRTYALPDYFGRLGPGRVRNLSTGKTIVPLLDGDMERFYPEAGTTLESAGTISNFEIAGVCGVHTQPASTGDALEWVSTDPADIDVVAVVTGDDASGRWTRSQVTLNGINPVAAGTWSFVDEAAKAYPASTTPPTALTSSRGTVTLRKVAGAVEIQKLFSHESAKDHQLITFFHKPAAAAVIAVPVIRKVKRLFHDADPVMDLWEPAIFEQLHVEWSVNRGEMSRENAQAIPMPMLRDLIMFDNETSRAGGANYSEPFR